MKNPAMTKPVVLHSQRNGFEEKPGSRLLPVSAVKSAQRSFERALADTDPDATDETAQGDGVFGLFGSLGSVTKEEPDEASDEAFLDLLVSLVEELYVSRDRRRPKVMIELSSDVLPEVSLTVLQDEGRITADFVCGLESSRSRLCAASNRLAQELANRLAVVSVVRVSTNNRADRSTLEISAQPTCGNEGAHDAG